MAEFFTGSGVYIFQLMLLILLAVVGALVLWLHFQFQRFKKMNESMPFLSEKLAENLREVQVSMRDIGEAVRRDMPKLESKISEAKLMMQEMEYVLSRSEKVMGSRASSHTSSVSTSSVEAAGPQKEDMSSVESSAQSLVERIVKKESPAEDKVQPRRVAPVYGAQAYGATIDRGAEHASENEEDLRRILQGRI